MDDQQALRQRAFRLTEQGLAGRNPPSLVSAEKVAVMVYKLLVAEVPRDQIEWVLQNARVLTESGIEYALRRSPVAHGAKPRMDMIPRSELFRPAPAEQERVRLLIQETRDNLKGR